MTTAKKTIVFGASPNPARYAYLATQMLHEYDHDVIPLGFRSGVIGNQEIITDWPSSVEDLDTVTLYLNPQRQEEFYDYILSLNPKRILFNPGTENKPFERMAEAQGIETEEACTLVLLRTGQY